MGGNNQTISRNQPEARPARSEIRPQNRPQIRPEHAPIVRKDRPKRDNPRLSGYVQFKLNNQIIEFIQVNQTRLYFKAYNEQQTVKTLQEQYRLLHKKKMKLETEVIKISPNMPISQIVTSTTSRQVFEEIVTKINTQQAISITDIPVEKKEIFETIIIKCNEFHRYEGNIHMNNGPEEPMKLGLEVRQDTTFNKVINMLNEYPQVIGNDIQFEDDQGKIIDHNLYDAPFEELNITSSFFNARFSSRNSLVRAGTFVSVMGVQGNEIMIERFQDHKEINLMSYDAKRNRIVMNGITNFKKQKINKYIQVTLIPKLQTQKNTKNKEIILEATASYRVCVLNRDFDYIWMSISRLKSYPIIGVVGIDKQSQSVVLYNIKSIENRYLRHPQFFYGLEALPSHQYIANSIIVHNSDSFTILCYNINDGQKNPIRFYRHQKISEILQDKICEVGGHILNNNHTFGDYQLDQIPTMIIYEKHKKILKKIERTLSQWQNPIIQQKKLDGNQKLLDAKLREYFGIYNHNIIPYSQIIKIHDPKRIVNIFVAYRIHFQRLYFYQNIQPKYQKIQDKIYQENKKTQIQCKKYFQSKQKAISRLNLNDKQLLAIYIYTTDQIYVQLNRYLRDSYINDNEQLNERYLSYTTWISNSLKKTKRYRGKVYRGLNKISLQKAFGLDDKRKSFSESSKIKCINSKQQIILNFTAFTSTTMTEFIAVNYAYEKREDSPPIVWEIQVQNGYLIQDFSKFPEEQQVLILPFTYFLLNSYDTNQQPQKAFLQQIPMPRGTHDKIVFWVDDNPENNDAFIEIFLQPNGIEVVQVTSTRIMDIIISNFFAFFKFLGKKIVIISDMVRYQAGKKNEVAGIDLFWTIYNTYGLSNKAIIYTMDKRRAIDAIKKKGIISDRWVVLVDQIELFNEVMLEFQKM